MVASAPRIAIVAGGSGGIGSAIVNALATNGFHVVAGVRAPNLMPALLGNIRYQPLNLECRASATTFASALQLPWIDVLVLCGAQVDGTWLHTLRVNALTHALLAETLRPLLQISPRHGRIVAISSGDGELAYLSSELRMRVENVTLATSFSEWSTMVERIPEDLDRESTMFAVHGAQKAYKLSKAILNSYVLAQSAWWLEGDTERVACVAVCPGDVDTPMLDQCPAGEVVSPRECVRRMWEILDVERDPQRFAGKFWRDGISIAW